MSEKYDNNSIKSLSDREAVRLRPSNYFGSNDVRGAIYSFIEVLDNSIDEFKTGNGNKVIVNKYEDNSIEIIDYARGLPVDFNKNEDKYNWELVCCKLNAGGKYSSDNYEFSKGLNGLGLSICQLSSKFMDIEVCRDGYKYTLHFKKGEIIGVLKKEKYNYISTGTKIRWIPDLDVFTENVIPNESIKDVLKKQAIVNKGLTLIFNDLKQNISETYYYRNGIIDYIKELNDNTNLSNIQYLETITKGKDREDKKEYEVKIQLAFCFNNKINVAEYYHNSSLLENGGSPKDAVENGFKYAIDKYFKDNNLYKQKEKITYDDIKDSFIVISNTYSSETSYENQTKKAITNKFIKDYMTDYIKQQLEIYFIENKLEADKIANQCLINMRARTRAEKTRLDIKSKLQTNAKGLSTKIEGFKHCDMRHSKLEERILLLDEGISANSTIIDSFDNRIMGAYGLKGRFINSLKASVSDVLNNIPAKGIIEGLGCGIEIPKEEKKIYKNFKTFNIEDLKYNSVGILCDRDAFGSGINLSLITFFYKFMPTLLKQGRIYLIISPRFQIEDKQKKSYYVYNEIEKNKIIKQIGEKNIDNITIRKGLGEFNKDEFWELVLCPEARKKTFIKINYMENEEEMIDYYFNALMGEDIANRKLFIKENIVDVDLNNID